MTGPSLSLRATGASGTCPADAGFGVIRPVAGDSFGRLVGLEDEKTVAEGETLELFSASEAFQWSGSVGPCPPGFFGEDARVTAPVDDLQIGDVLLIGNAEVQVLGPRPLWEVTNPVDYGLHNRPGIVVRALTRVTLKPDLAIQVATTQRHEVSCHRWFAKREAGDWQLLKRAGRRGDFELDAQLLAPVGVRVTP